MTDSAIKFNRGQRSTPQISMEIGFLPDLDTNDELSKFREQSWQEWKNLPFPDEKDEHWKRTSLKSLGLEKYKDGHHESGTASILPDHLVQSLAEKHQGGRVFISNNKVEITVDKEIEDKGVVFSDFSSVMKRNPGLISRLLEKYTKQTTYKFAALTNALSDNGVLLYVPAGIKVEKPLQSITLLSTAGVIQTTKILVILEDNAEVTFVHETSSSKSLPLQSLHLGVFDIIVGPGSKLNFVELQSLGTDIWNISHENVSLEKDSSIDWIFGSLGSKVSKNFSTLNLVGAGATGKMSGFYFSNETQHLDHDTRQNHLAPNTTSDLLFKGALLGESRSVWQGMIYVDPKASKTDGYQANRNLVLSQKARADSIPGLEILTDDVRCTHGATVGKIDQDLVFYLQSRGLPKKEAEKLIVEGFFDPIMQRIPFENVRQRFQKAIEEKMSAY
jgi:Fe-S cluster assembly protein SufD